MKRFAMLIVFCAIIVGCDNCRDTTSNTVTIADAAVSYDLTMIGNRSYLKIKDFGVDMDRSNSGEMVFNIIQDFEKNHPTLEIKNWTPYIKNRYALGIWIDHRLKGEK